MREWPVVTCQDERVDDAGCVIGAVNLAVMLVEAALLLAIWVLTVLAPAALRLLARALRAVHACAAGRLLETEAPRC